MRSRAKLPLHIIDAVGGCTAAACVIGFVYLTMVRNNSTATEIEDLTVSVQVAREDARVLAAARTRQSEVLADREAELAAGGRLPAETPTEEYFQTLSAMAARNRLQIIRNNPLPSRQYPGLLERRYEYEVTGATCDLVRFLKSIEESEFWADVSYLKVNRGTGPEHDVTDRRVAVVTLSLFSAAPSDESTSNGGG